MGRDDLCWGWIVLNRIDPSMAMAMACPDKSQVISTSAVPVYPYCTVLWKLTPGGHLTLVIHLMPGRLV